MLLYIRLCPEGFNIGSSIHSSIGVAEVLEMEGVSRRLSPHSHELAVTKITASHGLVLNPDIDLSRDELRQLGVGGTFTWLTERFQRVATVQEKGYLLCDNGEPIQNAARVFLSRDQALFNVRRTSPTHNKKKVTHVWNPYY